MLHRERAEAAQLNAVATSERAGNFVEYDIDDAFDVALKQVRIGARHLLNQLRLDHVMPHKAAFARPRAAAPAS